jgi:hypothetical protein
MWPGAGPCLLVPHNCTPTCIGLPKSSTCTGLHAGSVWTEQGSVGLFGAVGCELGEPAAWAASRFMSRRGEDDDVTTFQLGMDLRAVDSWQGMQRVARRVDELGYGVSASLITSEARRRSPLLRRSLVSVRAYGCDGFGVETVRVPSVFESQE